MAEHDFNVESLAAYLRIDPAQVVRMAERQKLPGRRVAGAWRFSPAEINRWMEERMSGSTDAELVAMETVLERSAAGGPRDEHPRLADLIPREAIAVPLLARTKDSVIRRMAELAAESGILWDAEAMAAAVRDREEMHSTALDSGAALLHPRRPLANVLAGPVVAVGLAGSGIPFGNPSGRLTDVFFLICSVDDRGHLRTLARLSRLLNDPSFLEELRACESADAVRALFAAREERLVA